MRKEGEEKRRGIRKHLFPFPLLDTTPRGEQVPKGVKKGRSQRLRGEEIRNILSFLTPREASQISSKDAEAFNEEIWLPLAGALVSSTPSLWEGKTLPRVRIEETLKGVDRLGRWAVRSYFLTGREYTIKALKAIFTWARFYSSWDLRTQPPKLPQGTLGKGPGKTWLYFPWALGELEWLREVPMRFGDNNPDPRILERLALLAAGKRSLPPGTSRTGREALLKHEEVLTTPIPSETKDPLLGGILPLMKDFAKEFLLFNSPKEKRKLHASVCTSGSLEEGRKKGGRAANILKSVKDFLHLPCRNSIKEFLNKREVGNPLDDEDVVYSLEGTPLSVKTLYGVLGSWDEVLVGSFLFQDSPTRNFIYDGKIDLPQDLFPEEYMGAVDALLGEKLKGRPQEVLTQYALWEGIRRKRISFPEEGLVGTILGLPFYSSRSPRRALPGERPLLSRVTEIPEKGFKNRVVTISEGWVTILLHLPREYCYWVLENDPRSSLSTHAKALYAATKELTEVLKGHYTPLEEERKRSLKDLVRGKRVLLSSDLTAATDETFKEVYDSLLEGTLAGMEEIFPKGGPMHTFGTLSSFPMRINYDLEEGLGDYDEEWWEQFEEEGEEQVRGYLMGNPLTWYLLNLLNLFCLSLGRILPGEKLTLRSLLDPETRTRLLSSVKSHRSQRLTKVCGDDLVALTTNGAATSYERLIKAAGNRLSDGSHLVSRWTANFTEEVSIVSRQVGTLVPLDVTFLKGLTKGVIPFGREKPSERPPPFFTRGEAMSTTMQYLSERKKGKPFPADKTAFGEGCYSFSLLRKRALSGLLYQAYKRELDPLRKMGIPIFLPGLLGGLSFPYYKGKDFLVRSIPKNQVLQYGEIIKRTPEDIFSRRGALAPLGKKQRKSRLIGGVEEKDLRELFVDVVSLLGGTHIHEEALVRLSFVHRFPPCSYEGYYTRDSGFKGSVPLWVPRPKYYEEFKEGNYITLGELISQYSGRLRRGGILNLPRRTVPGDYSFKSLKARTRENQVTLQGRNPPREALASSRVALRDFVNFQKGYLEKGFAKWLLNIMTGDSEGIDLPWPASIEDARGEEIPPPAPKEGGV